MNTPVQLMPVHRLILQATQWIEYVESSLDRVEYYPYPAFQHPDYPDTGVVGLAVCSDGLERIAQIATEGRNDLSVVATIVHEAAHLAGIDEQGTYFSEDFARDVEQRFLNDARLISALLVGDMQ